MASSSSATDRRNNYDVFLSFRGDTRNSFTSHLYGALCRNNIKAFIDTKIKTGEEITPTIERVIEGAKISIIVFSKNFADSSFCLDELVKIMECREFNRQIVLPIFYKVDPSEDSYRESFALHEQTTKQEMKVERWKSAFRKALELAGWPIDDKCVEAEKIEKITSQVLKNLKELNCSRSKGEKLICTSIIGQTAEDSFKKIWNCLMNDKTSRVGVYGMGGVGKTTIATLINNQLLEVANSFTNVYWVTVSKDSSISKLQSDIAKVIELDFFGEDDEKKRAAKLWEELKGQKFVLILDDVWKAFETEDVGIPLLAGGGKFLLTTRKLEVCQRMECQSIKVKPLSEDEARDLFMKESKCRINDSLEWRATVDSVVSECAGLPLAIVAVARCMRGVREISLLRNILSELERPCRVNLEMEDKVFKPLKVSYDCLHNDQYRQCLLYCSLFPEGCEIQRNGLVDYWIAEGLIDELDSRLEKLDKGNAIINELISASLLEHGRLRWKESIKMHDVVRDMALIIRRENKVKVVQPQDLLKETEWGVDIGRVSEMDNMLKRCDSNSAPNSSKLKVLSLRENCISELPCGFFANMPNLTVLDMQFLIALKVLPDSITNLGNLRVLILHECRLLEYVPSLGGLKNLRHLHLSNSSLKTIPKGMDRLLNLRVLKLLRNRSLYVLFPSAVLEKLSHLQSLELEGSNVKVELNAVISLKKLEKLSVNLCNFVSAQRNFGYFILGLRKFCDLQLHDLSSYFKSEHCRRLVEYNFVNFQDLNSHVAHRGLSLRLPMSPTCKKAVSLEPLKNVGTGEGETDIVFPDDIQQLQLVDWDIPMVDVLRNTTFANLQKLNIWGYQGRYLFMPALAQQLLHNVEELTIEGPRTRSEIWQYFRSEKFDKEKKEFWQIMKTKGGPNIFGKFWPSLATEYESLSKLEYIIATEEESLSELEDIIATEEESINQSNCNNIYSGQKSNCNNYPTIELPKLKSLTLNHLYGLTSIYKGRLVCPSLGSIFIDGCCELERLPFCMQEEGNKENPRIKLWIGDDDENFCWWGSLKWDNPNAKSKFALTC